MSSIFSHHLGRVSTMIVHTKTDRTVRGMLAMRDRNVIVLRPASIAVEENGVTTWTKIDGDVVIPMENVDFWQEGVEAQLAGLHTELFDNS